MKQRWSESARRDEYIRDRRMLIDLVREHRDAADGCLWRGVPIVEMRRDELLALLAVFFPQKSTIGF